MRECLTSRVGVESRFSGDFCHCIYINAVVSGSCVSVGKIIRLSVSSMFFYNKNPVRKILKEVGGGRIGFVVV